MMIAGLITAFVAGGIFTTICFGARDVIAERGAQMGEGIEAAVRRALHLPPMRSGAWRDD